MSPQPTVCCVAEICVPLPVASSVNVVSSVVVPHPVTPDRAATQVPFIWLILNAGFAFVGSCAALNVTAANVTTSNATAPVANLFMLCFITFLLVFDFECRQPQLGKEVKCWLAERFVPLYLIKRKISKIWLTSFRRESFFPGKSPQSLVKQAVQ